MCCRNYKLANKYLFLIVSNSLLMIKVLKTGRYWLFD